MEMSRLAEELKGLDKNEHRLIYESKNHVKVTVTHTGKFSERDYAVGLIIPDQQEFYPTHIRLLIDLYIKRESNPKGFQELYLALEEVFNGADPTLLIEKVCCLKFPMHLDEAEVNLYMTQLLMIEQDFNYGPDGPKVTKLKVAREFLMRFIRWIAAADTQIDKIIFNLARRYPAPSKYSTPVNDE